MTDVVRRQEWVDNHQVTEGLKVSKVCKHTSYTALSGNRDTTTEKWRLIDSGIKIPYSSFPRNRNPANRCPTGLRDPRRLERQNGIASVRVEVQGMHSTPQVRPRDPVELMSFT